MRNWVADFETTTDANNCYVWAYGICEVKNQDNVEIGTKLDDFMSWCQKLKSNDTIYFHNLKFDCQFIIAWLFEHGYTHVTDPKKRGTKTFTTLITDKGLYYTVEVIFKKQGKKVKKVVFKDSLKLIPLSVEEIAKAFKLPIGKLSIDYHAHNGLPEGTPLTVIEKQYLIHDVKIVAYALNYFFTQGLNKMTIGSCALTEYKRLVSDKLFKRFFPSPRFHDDVKQSYRGGFTWVNPEFQGKLVGKGIVLDVNSLYPSVMRGCGGEYLPYGEPIFFKGKYEKDEIYFLYTQMFTCSFDLKKGMIPTIQIKGNPRFKANEYVTTTNNEEVTLCLNSVDLELFLKHYDVYNIEYLSGWKFKGAKGLFDEYVDKWSAEKIKAKEEGNHGMYFISKLYLNNLYGKFGTDTKTKCKIPYYVDGVVKYRDGEEESKDGVYVAMASFITSYARRKTIEAGQQIMDDYASGKSDIQFVYADTDSLHCISPNLELPKSLDIHSTKLGAWDYEMCFEKGKYLRQKCYIEQRILSEDEYNKEILKDDFFLCSSNEGNFYKLKITVAGMPKGCYQHVNFDNFEVGASYHGKKVPKIVRGGCVLQDIDFTIK